MSDFEDVLKTHYAANPHVASQVAEISRRATEAGAAKQTGLPASEIGSDDAILQAHYAASPHVAAQVASNTGPTPPSAADTTAPLAPSDEVGGETFQPDAAPSDGGIELTPLTGLFEVRRRGKVTYYTQPGGIISSLVTRRDSDGDLTIHFAGLTGGTSVTNRDYLGHSNLAHMTPEVEIPRVFDCWSYWLKEAGLCAGLADVDLIEMQVFGCQPKDVNPLTSPQAYADECTRLREEYGSAYRQYFDARGMAYPCRYTVHLVDSPDTAASYEFYSVGLLQKGDGGGGGGAKL